MFDSVTCRSIKSYVYVLVNPITHRPFYVGKGEGNRVYNHVENVRSGRYKKEPKSDVIDDILKKGMEVEHYIVRHGMDEETAFKVEASLIDAFNLFDETKLSNLDRGHDKEHGLMRDIEISNKYSPKCIPLLPKDSIVININQRYHEKITDKEVYEATRQWWPLDSTKVGRIKYFFSEYQGVIIGVFEVDAVEQDEVNGRMRYGFRGHPAPDSICNQYYGKCLPIKAKRFPVLYSETVNAELTGGINTTIEPFQISGKLKRLKKWLHDLLS